MIKKFKPFLQLIPILLLIVIWQLYIGDSQQREFFLGSPKGIFYEFLELYSGHNLLRHFFITMIEAFLGFVLGTLLGTLFGLGFWLSKTIYYISKPYFIVLGSIPVFALGPILIFWFGTGIFSKIIIAFLSTFVIAMVQAINGTKETDSNLITLVQTFGGRKFDTLKLIILPSSLIWVLAGIRINIGMALLGAFVGEFISSREGLGHIIIVAEGLFNVNQIWVGIIGIIIIAMIFNFVALPIERIALKWKKNIN